MESYKVFNRASKLFQPIVAIQKQLIVKNEEIISKSQRLMLDLGIIRQSSPGSFHFLPLGVKAFEKLSKIVEYEMNQIQAQKVILPTLTNAKLWKTTGRFEGVSSELFKIQDRHNSSYILSPTHEESATDLLASVAPISYKHFPLRLYQITSKYRDEMKPRFGLMRARQFFMKDLYSFDIDVESAMKTYQSVCEAYNQIFKKIGIEYVKVEGATGNMGGSISHEYHFPSTIGEDKIIICSGCGYTGNIELSKSDNCPKCNSSDHINMSNGIEVGHTFLLGDKYSKPLKASYLAKNAKPVVLQMGSYGLGLSRILAAAIEVLSNENEIRWPSAFAPYRIIIIPPKEGSNEEVGTRNMADQLYQNLEQIPNLKNEILLDDRCNMTIGKRVMEAKRTGYPYIIVIGAKALDSPPLYEVIDVTNGTQLFLTKEQLMDLLNGD